MDINDFIQLFIESFDEIKVELKPTTKFKELEEWTSMQALILIAHIDDTIRIELDADDIANSSTIEDLYKACKAK